MLQGTGGHLLVASGTLGLAPGRVGTEKDTPDASVHPPIANAAYTLRLADRGIRSMVVRFAPTVHGAIGDGLNRWPPVNRLDAAKLVQLAVDKAPPGSVLHAVTEQGVATRDIATALGGFAAFKLRSWSNRSTPPFAPTPNEAFGC